MKFEWIVALAVVGAPSGAWASAPAADAEALVQSGKEHFKRREYEAACSDFAQAYALDAQPTTLLSLALAELDASQPVQAAAHLRAYLAAPDATGELRGKVEGKWLPRAEAQLARIELVAPPDAQVSVDGKPVARDPSLGVYEVVAGDHDVEVRSAGRDATEHVSAPAGATLMMRLLVDEPPPPAPPPLAEAPPEGTVDYGASPAKIATVVGLGVGALAGLGVGIGFDVAARDKAATLRSEQGCFANDPTSVACQRFNFDVSRQHTYEWTSIGGYVGAGVFALGGGLAWFLWPKAPVRVSAAATPHEAAVRLVGTW